MRPDGARANVPRVTPPPRPSGAPGPTRSWPAWLPFAATALVPLLVLGVLLGPGAQSLPGLGVLSVIGAALLGLLLATVPQVLVAVTPALLPLPGLWALFPFELVFAVLAFTVWLRGSQERLSWLWRLEPIEVANLLFILWSAFTGFWCFDAVWYAYGVRRMLLGFVAFWVAYRMPRFVSRPTFELGLLLGATTLALAAIAKRVSTGFSSHQAALRRSEATNLGWGAANYVATLLLLLSPLLLEAALHSRKRWLKLPSWPTLGLITVLQGIVASRAAGLLFAAGTIIQVFTTRGRQVITAIVIVLGFVGFFVSPLGRGILLRFTSVRELGSMAVRVWYFRVAWQRIVEFFPWGMGLNQGWVFPDRLFGRDPHNYWLAIAGETGVPGLILWTAVLVLLWKRLRLMARDPAWHDVGRALMISFWLGQAHTLVEPTFQGPHYQFVFFWLMGGYLGYHARDRAGSGPGIPMAGAQTPAADSSRR